MAELVRNAKSHFLFFQMPQTEYTIEITPQDTDWARIAFLGELGFNALIINAHIQDAVLKHTHTRQRACK